MLFTSTHRTIFLGAFVLILASADIFSQTPTGTAESPVELQNEPHHHLKFENEFVRVWHTVIPAKSTTLWHVHRNDNVVLTLNDASVRVETVDAAPAETQPKLGDVGFRKAPYVHRTMSVGATPFLNMAIEILSTGPASEKVEETGRVPVIDNERVRVHRISLAPGESTGMETDLFPGLVVSMTSGEVEIFLKGDKKPEYVKIFAGDVRWRDGVSTRSIRNTGKTPFEAVDIELK